MSFCTKCGHQLGENDAFCSECGEKVRKSSSEANRPAESVSAPSTSDPVQDVRETEPNTDRPADPSADPAVAQIERQSGGQASEQTQPAAPVTPPPAAVKPPRKKMSGVLKLIIALSVVVVVALAGGYLAGKMMFSPERLIESFRQAIEREDLDKLMQFVRPGDDKMGADKKDVQRLVNYYKDHRSDLDRAIRSLETQAKGGSDRRAALQLKTDGKQWLLFDRYVIEVSPFYMTLYTNLEGTELHIDGKEAAVADRDDYSKRFGPFWPGEYEVEAVYAGEYTTLRESREVELYSTKDEDVELTIEVGYVFLDSEVEDAIVYVNGKSTGRTVQDLSWELGPVSFDGKILLHAEAQLPWGTFQSDPVVLTPDLEYSYVTFTFGEAYDTALEQVMDAANEYIASWVMAYENMDLSYFTNITEERRSLFASDMLFMLETDLRFTGEIVGSEFDLNSFVLDGGYDGYPYTAMIEAAFLLENAGWYYLDEIPELGDMVSYIGFEMYFDENEGRWIISYFTSLDGIDFSNTQAYTFE
jgi:uncharacterized membrane protein YvbJ